MCNVWWESWKYTQYNKQHTLSAAWRLSANASHKHTYAHRTLPCITYRKRSKRQRQINPHTIHSELIMCIWWRFACPVRVILVRFRNALSSRYRKLWCASGKATLMRLTTVRKCILPYLPLSVCARFIQLHADFAFRTHTSRIPCSGCVCVFFPHCLRISKQSTAVGSLVYCFIGK